MTASQSPYAQRTLPQLLIERADGQADTPALRHKQLGIWRDVSWNDYLVAVRAFSLGLRSLGFTRRDRLAIVADNSVPWLVADLAVQGLGGMAVGVAPSAGALEMTELIAMSQARFVLCDGSLQADVIAQAIGRGALRADLVIACIDTRGLDAVGQGATPITFESIRQAGESRDADFASWRNDVLAASADEGAALVFSSGTRGPAKLVQLSHRSLLAAAESLAAVVRLDGHRLSMLSHLPLAYIAERSAAQALALCADGLVHFPEKPDTVAEDLRATRTTMFLGTPRVWQRLQRQILNDIADAPRLQRAIFAWALGGSGGSALRSLLILRAIRCHLGLSFSRSRFCFGALPHETLRFFDALGLPVTPLYGLSEAAGVVLAGRPGGDDTLHPLNGVDWRLSGDGELELRGPSVLPDATSLSHAGDGNAHQVFSTDGWLRTGDRFEARPGAGLAARSASSATAQATQAWAIEQAMGRAPQVQHVIVQSEVRGLVAYVQLDGESMARWAQGRDLQFTSMEALCEFDEVKKLVDELLGQAAHSAGLSGRTVRAVLIRRKLTHESGELNALGAVRRHLMAPAGSASAGATA